MLPFHLHRWAFSGSPERFLVHSSHLLKHHLPIGLNSYSLSVSTYMILLKTTVISVCVAQWLESRAAERERGCRSGFVFRSRQVGHGGIVVVSEPTFFVSYTHLRQLHAITDQPVVEAGLLSSTHDR